MLVHNGDSALKPYFSFAFILLLLTQTSFATTMTFEPAGFKDSGASLQRNLKFPKKIAKSDVDLTVVIRCDAYIKRNGKLSSNMCHEEGKGDYPYVKQINRAAERSRFKPGKVNGASKVTYFQYYVVFTKKKSQTLIEVIGNSGLEVERLGLDYTSPQRYREKGANFGSGCALNQKATVNAFINKLGEVLKVQVTGDSVSERCVASLTKSFLKQKYIPAMVNGEPIDAFYSEKIFRNMRQR